MGFEQGFGKILYSILVEKGMTQRELAEKINVSEVTISRYVTGIRVPKVTNIIAMSKALNVPYEKLLDV